MNCLKIGVKQLAKNAEGPFLVYVRRPKMSMLKLPSNCCICFRMSHQSLKKETSYNGNSV